MKNEQKTIISGADFIEHLNEIMVGNYIITKNPECIRQKWLSRSDWKELLRQVIGEEGWRQYECDYDSLFDDGGLSEVEYTGEVSTMLRDIAERIAYTIPMVDGVTVALQNFQYYDVYTIK